MQLSNTTAGLLLLVIAFGGTSIILKNKVERLETSVTEITKTGNENALALNNLRIQYNYIDAMKSILHIKDPKYFLSGIKRMVLRS